MPTDRHVPSAQCKIETACNPPAVSFPRHSWSWSTSIDNHFQEFQVLVIDYDAKKVLLRREGQHWILPGRLMCEDFSVECAESICLIPTVQDVIGTALRLAWLRLAWGRKKTMKIETGSIELEKSVVLMELIGAALAVGRGYRWIPIKEANIFHFFDDAAKTIRVEMEWALKGSQPQNRLAWQRPGWFCTTASWMEDVLRNRCGTSLTEGIIILRTSAEGVILRAKTTKGPFFLKCTAPLTNDAVYTQELARIVPLYVAKPIAVDAGNQLLVTADYGEVLDTFSFSKVEKECLSKDYARLQKATIGKTDELIGAGYPDLRPSKLLEHIDKLPLNDKFRALSGMSEESAGDVLFFCENTHTFKAMLAKLVDSNMPAVITHNDLWCTNVYKPAHSDNYKFFDWVEGFVGHPFTSSMGGIANESFLQEWTAYGSMDQLKEWLDIGTTFINLAFVIMRLHEASTREHMDAEELLDNTCSYLRRFNAPFRDD